MTLVEERPANADAAQARRAMIDSQLRVSGVNDPAILSAFDTVVREDFVPADRRAVAYADRAVPLGDGTVLAPALTHGQMLTAADIAPDDKVLVIGKPGAYLAALAGKLAGSVTQAGTADDWSATGPYSLILVDGAVEAVPAGLAAALADHGRVVTGLVERGVARLAIGRKIAGELVLTNLGEADFAAFPEFAAPKKWSF
ncbi:protein-L-isoaspartate O-methyltransferase [Novosphingobium sp. KCTC 2891]|uniref:protein-L-isoaspartate O-methyltransferase family protein n=1 Tax=Novosphingobium sp. KCTC 2891 TaxID=2989730 RepID=UPI0022218E72|nr:protein-L-isoaspartate O-methyltransferase [Novosphingobium sp. KCTC 2891]MCW1382208.1 protein-L-isoaspartate O-methyltransferase [Novosphingobium sp. KCTC 2891]